MKKIILLLFIICVFISTNAFSTEIYHYDKITKALIGSSIAKVDPIEGKDLIPAFATNQLPPVSGLNEIAIFNNNSWIKKIDRVGEYYYLHDGARIIISEYGIDIPSGILQEDPPTKYHDSHNGVVWVENTALKDQELVFEEIQILKSDLKTALVWQFRMIEAVYELGVEKGVWSGSDISDIELKEKYLEWKNKLVRLRELGE